MRPIVKPEGSAPAVKILHHTVICCAKKRIWIQNPYFIPEPEAIEAFGKAVASGVDVRVLMPSTSGSDNPMVQHAGHRNFEKLLRCGVRLFEYPSTLLHQKVMTIDGVWCAIGSANFDDRSFEINDEITLGFKDAATAKRLDEIFEKYCPHCDEIKLEKWRKRGWRHKLHRQCLLPLQRGALTHRRGINGTYWKIDADGVDLSGEYIAVEVLNIRFVGPNLPLAPEADPSDGMLDVVLVGEADRKPLLAYVENRLHLASGQLPDLRVVPASIIEMIAPAGVQCHLDDQVWPLDQHLDHAATLSVSCQSGAATFVGTAEGPPRSRPTISSVTGRKQQ